MEAKIHSYSSMQTKKIRFMTLADQKDLCWACVGRVPFLVLQHIFQPLRRSLKVSRHGGRLSEMKDLALPASQFTNDTLCFLLRGENELHSCHLGTSKQLHPPQSFDSWPGSLPSVCHQGRLWDTQQEQYHADRRRQEAKTSGSH